MGDGKCAVLYQIEHLMCISTDSGEAMGHKIGFTELRLKGQPG